MGKQQKKKVRYELRSFIHEDRSIIVEKFTDKDAAIESAEYESKQEDDRIYFVKMITEQVIFFVGEWG